METTFKELASDNRNVGKASCPFNADVREGFA